MKRRICIKLNSNNTCIWLKMMLLFGFFFCVIGNVNARERDELVVQYLKNSRLCAFKNQKDSAIYYLEKAKIQALGNPDELFRVYNRGANYFFKEDIKLDSAKTYMQKMSALLPALEYDVLKSRLYNKLGYFYGLNGNIKEAFQAYNSAIIINRKLEEYTNYKVLANSYVKLGRLYGRLELYPTAKSYFKKAIALLKEDPEIDQVFIYRHLACVYKKMGAIDDAMSYLQKAIKINEENSLSRAYESHQINTQKNLAEIYYIKEDRKQALFYVLESIKNASKIQRKDLDVRLFLLLSKIYNDEGDVDLAFINGLKSFEIAKAKDIPYQILMSSKQLKLLYKNIGNTEKAYFYLDIYNKTKNRIYREEAKVTILKAEYLEDLRKEKLATNKIQEASYFHALLIIGICLVLLGIVYTFYQRKKEVLQQRIVSNEKSKYRIQQKLQDERKRALEKENELSVYMRMLSQQTDAGSEATIVKMKSTLQQLHSLKILTEDDWLEFKTLFLNIYPNFYKNFKINVADYSLGDLKLASLIRLSLNTKEIANILAISPESVRKGKYRLRKKMTFTSEKELQKFIYSL